MTSTLDPRPALAEFLERGAKTFGALPPVGDDDLHCGVDLGTATIVIAVISTSGEPVYLNSIRSDAVRDGVVVDFHSAVEAVVKLRHEAEMSIGRQIHTAATAYPPGVGRSESRACQFVLEQAGLQCVGLIDEVSAANALLEIEDGVIVDVGGGSTGVGIMLSGELVQVADLPGGGHHLDLILAGALHVPIEAAEQLKRESGREYLHVLRPGVERIANSIARLSTGFEHLAVHLVGGALMLPGATEIVAGYLDRPAIEYPHPLYITPFGIARSAR